MDFNLIIDRALVIRQKLEAFEIKNAKVWDTEQILVGLVGDIGSLSKLVQAHEGFRKVDDLDMKLKHELSDCLWAIIVISKKLNIDLESAFFDTMDTIEEKISQ